MHRRKCCVRLINYMKAGVIVMASCYYCISFYFFLSRVNSFLSCVSTVFAEHENVNSVECESNIILFSTSSAARSCKSNPLRHVGSMLLSVFVACLEFSETGSTPDRLFAVSCRQSQ
jgi:hypothetical protein